MVAKLSGGRNRLLVAEPARDTTTTLPTYRIVQWKDFIILSALSPSYAALELGTRNSWLAWALQEMYAHIARKIKHVRETVLLYSASNEALVFKLNTGCLTIPPFPISICKPVVSLMHVLHG